MNASLRLMMGALLCAGVAGQAQGADPAEARIAFNRDIRPILSDHCFACHGPDKAQRKAELRLDLRDEAVASGAITPGNAEESEVYWRVVSDEPTEVMPPPESNKPLDARQKELITRWLAEGGEYQPHWAYMAPRRPDVPAVEGGEVKNAIDAFVQSRLKSEGFEPAPEAERRTLIRRLHLDLTGLPPTPDEVEAFVADQRAEAYDEAVERLLGSVHFGERMATGWLDVVRYADTVGYHGDQNQNAWAYRDYVVGAFNANKPFDQFTAEQLAGDLLPEVSPETLTATCFNRLNMVTREGGAQPGEYLAKATADRVRTVGMAWMGSTLACCECHDHKFDPFSTRDFYSLGAFFADIKQWGVYNDYSYTPNPDLKGFSNDHPFPPETTVESPYLNERIALLENRRDEVVAAAARGRTQSAAFDAWRDEVAAFLKANPSGWAAGKPLVSVRGNEKKEGETGEGEIVAAVSEDGRVQVPGEKATDDTVRLEPGAGWVAAVRLELLPDPARGGSILRSGTSLSIRPDLKIERAGAESKETLKVRFAGANRAAARYQNGFEVLGIQDGWITRSDAVREPHTGVYLLEKPVRLAAGDAVVVTLAGNRGANYRVSVTPLPPRDPRESGLGESLAAAIAKPDGAIEEFYLRSTAWDAAAYEQVMNLDQSIRECRDGKTPVLVVEAVEPMVSRILPRGNWQDESGEIVAPAVPAFLPQPEGAASGERLTRLDLARWLTSPENPLTARVFVNRLWKQYFGAGLSGMVDDLGAQGESPSHPELLDWLAVEFQESGWDVKHMVRLMVLSHTYRQSSNPTPELFERDPANRLLARQSPRRLEAEVVRDNALAIAGLINLDVGGPPRFPYQPPGYYANLQFPDREYMNDTDERQYRRGVYMHWQRTFLQPMLANFDAPSREDCIAARTQANSPQQALTLLNDTTFVEAARGLASRVMFMEGDDAGKIERAFRLALGRPPRGEELDSLSAFLKEMRAEFAAHPDEERKLAQVGNLPEPAAWSPGEYGAWTNLCRVILNLHETITRY